MIEIVGLEIGRGHLLLDDRRAAFLRDGGEQVQAAELAGSVGPEHAGKANWALLILAQAECPINRIITR